MAVEKGLGSGGTHPRTQQRMGLEKLRQGSLKRIHHQAHLTHLDLGKVLKVRTHQESLDGPNSPLRGSALATPGSWGHEDAAGCFGPPGLVLVSHCRPQPGPSRDQGAWAELGKS